MFNFRFVLVLLVVLVLDLPQTGSLWLSRTRTTTRRVNTYRFGNRGGFAPQIENCSRTCGGTRTGRPLCALIGHQSVRAFDNNWPSLLRRISVNRSNVSRVALPTHVRNTRSSPKPAGAL